MTVHQTTRNEERLYVRGVEYWPLDRAVGERVFELMDRWSDQQVDLARILGIQAQALGRKLRGERRWYLSEVLAIADHYQIALDYLIRGLSPTRA